MILVDTTFLVDLARGKESAITKAKELEKTPPIYYAEISTYELSLGLPSGQENFQKRLVKLNTLLQNFEGLPLTHSAALLAGKIAGDLNRSGEEIGDLDCLIAAIALSNGIKKILTKNEKHFSRIKEISVETY